MTNETFGQMIRRRRLALGISQEWLADRGGTDRSHLSQIERGKIGTPQDPLRSALVAAIEQAERDRGIPVEPLRFGATVQATPGTMTLHAGTATVTTDETERDDPLSPEDQALLDQVLLSGARSLTPEGRRLLLEQVKLLQQFFTDPHGSNSR